MKKLKLLLLLLSFAVISNLFSQNEKAFEVDYVTKLNLNADQIISNIPAAMRAQVEGVLRDEIKNGIYLDYKLLTNGRKSVYKLQPKLNNAQGAAGLILNQISSQDAGALIKNLDSLTYVKEVKIMATNYLIKNNLSNIEWEVSRETDMIAGYGVRKATGVMNDSIKVDAWFSSKIPIKDGPDKVSGLPGLILKISMNTDGNLVVVTANKITVREEDLEIKKLTPGKVVSEEEFMKIVKELQQKMKEMHGGGVDVEN